MKKDNYDSAVKVIKTAILQMQYEAIKSVNAKQLQLYFAIGKYISINSRNGVWGEGAIDAISEKLEREMPGLRGYSGRNLRCMRTFYEEWHFLENVPNSNLESADAKLENSIIVRSFIIPNAFPMEEFVSIGFTLHVVIMSKIKSIDERLFYIKKTANEHFTREQLKEAIASDAYHHQGQLPNNFMNTFPIETQAFKAIESFKDEYLLDNLNAEEIVIRDKEDTDERVLENRIVHNIKKTILTFGKDFAFIRNQYHISAFGEDQYIDLLFFNRELNCLVAIELKKGDFKPAYLGQLSGYLSVLNKFERKEHENQPIGIILCKNMNKSYVDFIIQDYTKPMGVATYKDLSEEVKKCLPSIDELTKILDDEEEGEKENE